MSILSFNREERETKAPAPQRTDYRAHYEALAIAALASALRHRLFIFSAVALTLVAASLLVALLPRKYSAEALIQPRLLSTEHGKAAPLASVDATSLVGSEVRLILSDEIVQRVVRRLGLDKELEAARSSSWLAWSDGLRTVFLPETSKASSFDRAVALLRNRVVVARDSRSYVISIYHSARSPDEAARVVNAFALEYVRAKALETRLAVVARAEAELERQAAVYGSRHPKLLLAQDALEEAKAAVVATVSAGGDLDMGVVEDLKLANPSRTPTSPKGLEILGLAFVVSLAGAAGAAVWKDRKRPKKRTRRRASARSPARGRKGGRSRATVPHSLRLQAAARLMACLAWLKGTAASGRLLLQGRSWTLIDQAVVGVGIFLLNVLLARALGPGDYGAFALFLGAVLLLRAVDYAFVSCPLAARLETAEVPERPVLVGATIQLAAAFAFCSMAIVGAGIVAFGATGILLPACLCILCWQAHETLRLCLLAEGRHRTAVIGDVVAYGGQPVLIAVLLWSDALALPSALQAMAAPFALGAALHCSRLAVVWPTLARVRSEWSHIAFRRFSLANVTLAALNVHVFSWILVAVAGLGAVASFQAGLNIATLLAPAVSGVGSAVPWRIAGGDPSDVAPRGAGGHVLGGLAAMMALCVGALVAPEVLLRMVYGEGSPFVALAVPLQLLMLACVVEHVASIVGRTLRCMQSGRPALLVNLAVTALSFALALAFIDTMGLLGACLALLMASVTRLVVALAANAWLTRRERRRMPRLMAPEGSAPGDTVCAPEPRQGNARPGAAVG